MEEELIYEEPKWKKRITLIFGIIILLILLIYFLFGNIFGIVEGLLESSDIKNNEVIVDGNIKLVFVNDSYNKLLDLYWNNLGKEFKACLMGKDYVIDEIFLPKMFSQKSNQVISEVCPKGTLVDLHSHPDNHCLFSEEDINSFAKTKENFTIMAVLCEEDKFNFYY